MKELIKKAKYLLDNNKVKKISDRMWEVEDNLVSFKQKPGRCFMTCSCGNSTKFCSESPLCCHKFAVGQFELNSKFKERLNKIIKDYKQTKEIAKEIDIDVVVTELEDLGRTL